MKCKFCGSEMYLDDKDCSRQGIEYIWLCYCCGVTCFQFFDRRCICVAEAWRDSDGCSLSFDARK